MQLITQNDCVEVVYKALRTPPLKGVFTDTMSLATAMMQEVPTIEAEPVRHSRWIDTQDTSGHHYQRCRECGTYIEDVFFANDYDVNYCPCCGAKMDL